MVRNKDIKKALYNLRKYTQTPIEVIEYMKKKLFEDDNDTKAENSYLQDNRRVNILRDNIGYLTNGIKLKNLDSLSGNKEFKKFDKNFLALTGEHIKMTLKDFNEAEKFVIDGKYLDSVKVIKRATEYPLVSIKTIADAIRDIHKKGI